MNIKRIIASCLSLAMLLLIIPGAGLGVSAAQWKFTDVRESDWFYPYVKELTERGMTSGVSADKYAPSASVTYAEVAAFIVRYLGIEDMAKDLLSQMKSQKIEGAQLWYAGYMQVVFRAGIMLPESFDAELTGECYPTGALSAAKIEAPAVRVEVMAAIARSFELDESGIESRILPREVSPYGHELIIGGGYDRPSLDKLKAQITDIGKIDETYLDYVLKCIYNGIINGDENGNVNPNKTITRAEISKIIAAAVNMNLRQRTETRDFAPELRVTSADFVVSPRTGETVINPAKAELLLRAAAMSVTASLPENGIRLEYSLPNIMPQGYIYQAVAFIKSGNRFVEFGRLAPDVKGSAMLPMYKRTTPTRHDLQIVYILRNVKRQGAIEATLTCKIDTSAKITFHFES